jgi:two-component sensor histidine kinase
LQAPDATKAAAGRISEEPPNCGAAVRKKDQTMKSKGPTVYFEARLLLREFSHRINNEFASAIGVIAIAARSANDEARHKTPMND